MTREKLADLPEAPASATCKVVSPKGFHYLFTLREGSGKDLLEKLDLFEDDVINRGWKAEEQSYGKPAAPAAAKPAGGITTEATCATCGQPAQDKRGVSKSGKPYHAIFCQSGDKNHTVWL